MAYVYGTPCPPHQFPKSYHFHLWLASLHTNPLFFGFTVALLTVDYISLTSSLSLVLLTNISLTDLRLPKLHFYFLCHLYANTFIPLCLFYIVEFYIYLLVTRLFTELFLVCFTVTEVVNFIFNHIVIFQAAKGIALLI